MPYWLQAVTNKIHQNRDFSQFLSNAQSSEFNDVICIINCASTWGSVISISPPLPRGKGKTKGKEGTKGGARIACTLSRNCPRSARVPSFVPSLPFVFPFPLGRGGDLEEKMGRERRKWTSWLINRCSLCRNVLDLLFHFMTLLQCELSSQTF